MLLERASAAISSESIFGATSLDGNKSSGNCRLDHPNGDTSSESIQREIVFSRKDIRYLSESRCRAHSENSIAISGNRGLGIGSQIRCMLPSIPLSSHVQLTAFQFHFSHSNQGCDSVINLKDFNELYSVPDLVAMEKKVLQTIGFELGIPIAWDFLQMLGKHLKLSPAIVTLAGNILRLTPNEYNFVAVDEGKKAAAALFIALRMTNQSGWNQIARYFTGKSLHALIAWCL